MCRFLILHGEMRERAFLTKGICMCVRLSLRLKCLIWRRSIHIYISVCVQVVFFVDPKKAIFISSFGARTPPPNVMCVSIYM